MVQFLVKIPHTEAECLKALDELGIQRQVELTSVVRRFLCPCT